MKNKNKVIWLDEMDGFLENWKYEAQKREEWKEWRKAFA